MKKHHPSLSDRNLRWALVLLTVLGCGARSWAQKSTIDQVLDQVARNNKRLAADAGDLRAKGLQERVGLSLPDPTVDFDWMGGTPTATAGTQQDLTIAQAFEFPTAYSARRRSAALRIGQHEQQLLIDRREVLFDAQRTCLALVHANQRAALLARRLEVATRFRQAIKERFDREAETILALNKADLLQAGIAADVRSAKVEQQALLQHLTELNGGQALVFTDTVYPPLPEPPPFEEYEREVETADPLLRMLESETALSEERTRMHKATGLPQFELGYRYQGILGATYNGVHAGLVVPLWSNRFKVQQQQAWTAASSLRTEEHRTEHYFEARHRYDRATELRAIADEYEALMKTASNADLLERAFNAGQLTGLTYHLELLLLQESQDKALEMRWRSEDAAAEMYSYRL